MKNISARPPSPKSESGRPNTQPTDDQKEQIRARAYRIYEKRGLRSGHELEDWLEAEAETRAEKTKIKAVTQLT